MSPKWTQKEMARVAAEERSALGLDLMDPLDPYLLAEAWGLPVYAISELTAHDCPSETIEYFLTTNSRKWSAALIPVGSGRLIIENDSHSTVRRRSSVAHEMSHHLLEHVFPEGVLGSDHDKLYSKTVEKQALFTSGSSSPRKRHAGSSRSVTLTMPRLQPSSRSVPRWPRCR